MSDVSTMNVSKRGGERRREEEEVRGVELWCDECTSSLEDDPAEYVVYVAYVSLITSFSVSLNVRLASELY